MDSIRQGYISCLIAGVLIATGLVRAQYLLEFIFVGEPVVCRTSFPRYHNACIYSRFGFGEQSITLYIDDTSVFSINDFAPGNLNENVTWDSIGRNVTFYADGLGDITYDAEDMIRLEE